MDGALLTTAGTLHARAEGAIAHISIGDRARGAALRAGLFHPCVWSVFQQLGPAGQAGALAALAFCRDADEAEDAVQAAALLAIDPLRQAAAAARAAGCGLTFGVADPEARARNGKSRARREHIARARGGVDLVRAEHARRRAGIQDHLARALGGADEPRDDDDFGADPLMLLLRAEAEDLDGCDELLTRGALALLKPPRPRPRGRPTRGETLAAHGQQQLPGLAPGGSTTKAGGQMPPAGALAPVAPPAQLNLFGRPDVFLI